MTFYADLAATATELLAELGEAGSIRRRTVTGGGPSALSGGAATVTDYACRVAVLPVTQRDVDGTLVKAGDFQAFVAPGVAVTPATTDKLVCSLGVLTIVDAGEVKPAGTVTHYEMIVRRA